MIITGNNILKLFGYIKSDVKNFFTMNMFENYEKIVDIYDEPFANGSQIPIILSNFVSKDVFNW